jgi:O-antigen/teichoic acid export membrane protein
MVMGIIMTPFWSAITEACKQDVPDKTTMKQLQLLWVVLSLFTLGMLLVSNFVYKLWVGKDLFIPLSIS